MFSLVVTRKSLGEFTKNTPARVHAAMVSALRAESRVLALRQRDYSRSWGGGEWGQVHPLTPKVRKSRRQGLGKFLGRHAKYHVDVKSMEGMAGVLDPAKIHGARFAIAQQPAYVFPVAYRHARGYRFEVTRELQGRLATMLRQRYKTAKKLSRLIPKLGMHSVPPRPTADVVAKREHRQSIARMREVFSAKMAGRRYRDFT